MNDPNRIALLIAVLCCALLAQEVPTSTDQKSLEKVMGERDRRTEDQIAKLFEGIRFDAKLPYLKRIRHRDDLEQELCTSVLTGKPPKCPSAYYTTDRPELITPELKKIASSNRVASKNKPWYARYSVAVWRVKSLQTGRLTYWVSVGLYDTAIGEFVDCHFTDDIHYCGNWKETIARPCRGK